MENINRISFFNLGDTFLKSDGDDYYDIIKPGIAVMCGENHNYICYYDKSKVVKIQKMLLTDEWYESAGKYLIETRKIEIDSKFISGLLNCADNEDEDGLYEYLEEMEEQVVFTSPNNKIDAEIGIFIVKQHGDENSLMKTDGTKLYLNNQIIELLNLSVGHFNTLQDPLLVYTI